MALLPHGRLHCPKRCSRLFVKEDDLMSEWKNPLGIEDFKTLKRECYYVDKTKLVSRIIHAPKSSVFLFTRPRRFGKSLALSTIETFYNDREDSRPFFDDTLLAKEDPLYGTEISSHPVLHINLKRCEGESYPEFLRLFQYDLSRLAKKVCRSYNIEAKDEWLRLLVDERCDETLLKTALDRLVDLLYEETGRESVVLVDEYDLPLQKGYDNGYFEQVQSFIKVFLGDVLKGNSHLYRSVVTGVTEIAHASVFSDLNNLRVNTILSNTEEEFFGFSQSEVSALLQAFETSASLEQLREWYGGYRFQGFPIFNPWSILSFIENKGQFDLYWSNSGSNSLIKRAVSSLSGGDKGEIYRLLSEESISVNVDKTIQLGKKGEGMDALYSLLIHSGYLSASPLLPPSLYSVSIPNKEIASCFRNEILEFNGKTPLLSALLGLKEAIEQGKTSKIEEVLSRYILACFSYFDLSAEKIYQIILTTIMALLFDGANVKSEVIEGEGRCDIYIQGKRGYPFSYVIELKKRNGKKSREELQKTAEVALQQILKKNYCEDALRDGSEQVFAYGFAFSGKNVAVKSAKVK